ncbi:signal peptidase I [Virgibacillus sp. W0430]|uniref:signal peptidase I n=1 Tax=Virgibacillus sp. W0430 TaxID=3391580 RepID=UPI003F45BAA2
MRKKELFDWLKALLVAFGIAFIIRMFIFSPIIVDGPSMLPTLHDRDQIIVNKFIYHLNEPKRFDIVIFHASEQKDFIKRVIGLPGEHVMMKENTLYIDGEEVEEKFTKKNNIHTDDFTLELLPGHFESIPDGYVLVLGDNRTNSTDSRRLGLIPIDQIVGKATFIYWPFERIQIVKE